MQADVSHWGQTSPYYAAELPLLDFPFTDLPDLYAPQSTVLRMSDGVLSHVYLWCYLERKPQRGATRFNRSSLSSVRVKTLPAALKKLSDWCRFDAVRPSTAGARLSYVSQFLQWTDLPEHAGQYENVLADPDLALKALQAHHAFLRQVVQGHQLGKGTASQRDQRAISALSVIHDRAYVEVIEPLADWRGEGTPLPEAADVAEFLATLTAIFDSAVRSLSRGGEAGVDADERLGRTIELSGGRSTELPDSYSDERLMELACVTFAAIAIADSGANLAPLQAMEIPDDIHEQLLNPSRVNQVHREVKFRAGGAPVPILFTVTTTSRMGAFLNIRAKLIERLGCDDPQTLLLQCSYRSAEAGYGLRTPASGVKRLNDYFLTYLRAKVKAVGGQLPDVNLRQLRLYKQGKVLAQDGVVVASKVMGHSLATAIRAYSKVQRDVRAGEMSGFLASLASTVVDGRRAGAPVASLIPSGSCAAPGQPILRGASRPDAPQVVPDCRKFEGCFFCGQYRLHADEIDLRKLLSCRHVLKRLAPVKGVAPADDDLYNAVLDRVEALAAEIRKRAAIDFQRIADDVDIAGNLTLYWGAKLQQLSLLGLLERLDPPLPRGRMRPAGE